MLCIALDENIRAKEQMFLFWNNNCSIVYIEQMFVQWEVYMSKLVVDNAERTFSKVK